MWEDFIVQLTATLIGVVIGIPIAFWINKKISDYKRTEEKESLIEFLKNNLNENLRLIKQMKNELPTHVVFYPIDIGSWPLFSQKIYLLDNINLKKKIFNAYFKLEHLSRKVDRQFEMHYSSFRAIKNYNQERNDLVGSVITQIDNIEKIINEILRELNDMSKNEKKVSISKVIGIILSLFVIPLILVGLAIIYQGLDSKVAVAAAVGAAIGVSYSRGIYLLSEIRNK